MVCAQHIMYICVSVSLSFVSRSICICVSLSVCPSIAHSPCVRVCVCACACACARARARARVRVCVCVSLPPSLSVSLSRFSCFSSTHDHITNCSAMSVRCNHDRQDTATGSWVTQIKNSYRIKSILSIVLSKGHMNYVHV